MSHLEPREQSPRARPYPHQVGGHGQLAMTNSGRLLKPLLKKEHAFYQYIHSDALPSHLRWIRHVTPQYYGESDFPNIPSPRLHTPSPPPTAATSTSSLDPEAVATALHAHLPTSNAVAMAAARPRWRHVSDAGDAALVSATISPWAAQMRTRPNNPPTPPPSPPAWPASVPSSPLATDGVVPSSTDIPSMNVPSMNIPSPPPSPSSALGGNPRRKPRRRSIALEDINRCFSRPCVMDCKIGTRHYDDDASVEKRRRHIAKANATTSAKCGVRYMGMQSFKRAEACSRDGIFETTDKYHGRKLREPDLLLEATWFFHDNFHVRVDCIKLVLEQLTRLQTWLVAQNHFYFYSSSLLLVYEGALPNETPPRVDVRMIDFAHTVLSQGQRDDGYLKGINYLIRVMNDILVDDDLGRIRLPPRVIASRETKTEDMLANDLSAMRVEESPLTEDNQLVVKDGSVAVDLTTTTMASPMPRRVELPLLPLSGVGTVKAEAETAAAVAKTSRG